MALKVFNDTYPFMPRSGKILNKNATQRVERYYENENFEGRYFNITFTTDEITGDETSFSVSQTLETE